MTTDEISALREGDLIRHSSGELYVVLIGAGDGTVVATRTVTVETPAMWELFARSPRQHDDKEGPK